LGGSHNQIVGQLFVEGLVLALLGGAGALVDVPGSADVKNGLWKSLSPRR